MLRFVARRLIGMVAVLFAISVIVFLIFNVIPNSDPAARIAGKNANPALIARVSADLGLDKPLPVQYLTMMKQIFTGELTSYASSQNVAEQIWDGLPATLSLTIGAAVLWMALAIWFGYLSAVHAGRFTDRALTILALVGISMPVFWLAAILLYFFSFKVQLFPTGSYVPLTEDPLQWAYHLILPWFTLAVLYVGFYSRVLRSNMLDSMNEDYVRTARAKGISERQVRIRHVLRNSMIPIVTLFGLDFGAVVGGGAILTETVFNINGVGLYAGQAIGKLDLPPLMAVTMFGAFFIVLFNTIVDILYAVLDPRIRLGEAAPV
ncbi:MAG: ABC transporter permease [Mycobacterium sp.]